MNEVHIEDKQMLLSYQTHYENLTGYDEDPLWLAMKAHQPSLRQRSICEAFSPFSANRLPLIVI
jgi:hypothetical protein